MGNKRKPQRRQKPKSFADQLSSMFGANKQAEAAEKDDRPSIAERINFGGQFSKKKKRRPRK